MAKKRGKGPSSWATAAAGFIIGVAVVFLIIKFTGNDKAERPDIVKPPVATTLPGERGPETVIPDTADGRTAVHPVVTPPRVSIVIDDMGADLEKLRALMRLDSPITIAVMPHLKYSAQVATEAHARGWDVIMHLPMEPQDMGENDPGVGALLVVMTPEEVRTQMVNDFKTVPYALGVNNHMGSKFTEDAELMKVVMQEVKKKKMFFLDSRTSPDSVVEKLARSMKVDSAVRNVFLDNTREKGYIKGQIRELVSIAKKRGKAIGIGHPYPETIEALAETVDELGRQGVTVVRLSDLVESR